MEGRVAASFWALRWGVCRRFLQAAETAGLKTNLHWLFFWGGRGISCGSCAVMPITGKGHTQPVNWNEGRSRCSGPRLSLRRPGCDPKLQQKHRHKTGNDETRRPWRLPSHLQHGGSWETSCPPQLRLPNISDLLILPEQFSVHSAASLGVQQTKWLHTPRAGFENPPRSIHPCFPEDLLYTATRGRGNKRLLLSEY